MCHCLPKPNTFKSYYIAQGGIRFFTAGIFFQGETVQGLVLIQHQFCGIGQRSGWSIAGLATEERNEEYPCHGEKYTEYLHHSHSLSQDGDGNEEDYGRL